MNSASLAYASGWDGLFAQRQIQKSKKTLRPVSTNVQCGISFFARRRKISLFFYFVKISLRLENRSLMRTIMAVASAKSGFAASN